MDCSVPFLLSVVGLLAIISNFTILNLFFLSSFLLSFFLNQCKNALDWFMRNDNGLTV